MAEDNDYIPPCESENQNECNEIVMVPDAQFFEKKWFNKEWNEYNIQWTNEDPAMIVLELFNKAKVWGEFTAFLRYSEVIAKMWKIELKKWDKITLDKIWIWQYELNIWKKIYTVETVQNKIYEIK